MRVLVFHVGQCAHLTRELGSLSVESSDVSAGSRKLRPKSLAFAGGFGIHLNQLEYTHPFLAQLQVHFLELIFVERELMTAGFERRRAAEPIVGVFDIGGIHGRCLALYCSDIQ